MSVRVTLEDVRVVLGGSEILHGVSLELAPGSQPQIVHFCLQS